MSVPKPPSGPHPEKGIMYYKAIDVGKGLFAKWRIAEESSARIAVGCVVPIPCPLARKKD
jgi:hypothetical protein